MDGHDQPTDYRRELDLDRAVVRVRYRVGGTTFTREVFSSAPDQAIVVRLTADGPGEAPLHASTWTASIPSPCGRCRRRPPDERPLARRPRRARGPPEASHGLQARWYGEGLAFAVQIAAEATGGRVEVDEKGLRVVDAESVTLRLAAATSFRGRDPEAALRGRAAGARGRTHELLARHLADHRSLFRRVRLDLGSADRRRAADGRAPGARARRERPIPGLAALYFQYGRYLLIASSRPGTQPANLQGIWNDDSTRPGAATTRSTSTPR